MSPTENAIDLLKSRSMQLSVTLSEQQCQTIGRYLVELERYNSHTNLVSDASPETLVADHVVDSISLVSFIEGFKRGKPTGKQTMKLIDIGSGAGFPGLILGIVVPYLEVVLVESTGKKASFLQSFIETGNLTDRIKVISERAEQLAHQPRYREKFDVATARAVGTVDVTAELCLPFLKVGAYLLLQKSLAQKEESTRRAAHCLPKLGGEIIEVTTLDAMVLGKERVVMVAKKQSKTASSFPRDWAKIKHQPL